MSVGVMKPVDTGCAEIDGELQSKDAQALALAVGSTLPLELICPYRYRATEVDRSAPPDPANIARCFHEIAAQNDVVLVESADAIDFAELGALFGLEVIVVVGNRPGCEDAATLVLQRCEDRGLKVAGYILCDGDPASSSVTETIEASLKRLLNAPYLGRMRNREPLARTIVEKLL